VVPNNHEFWTGIAGDIFPVIALSVYHKVVFSFRYLEGINPDLMIP